MELMRKLHSPEIVASFQRFCGVCIQNEAKGEQNGGSPTAAAAERPTPPTPHTDGYTAVRTRSRTNASNISHTTANGNGQNGFVQNGHLHSPLEVKHSGSEHPSPRENGSHVPGESTHTDGEVKYSVTNKLLYYMFVVGAAIGDEIFYCILWSTWFWNFDGYVCRRVVYIWCFIMYVGQATKDIIRWPRPASPPVARMEKRYELEYGMPSTHAMVGAAIPFSTYFLASARYQIPATFCLVFCLMWCALVCLSRLYLGMHSLLDVLVGLVYVGLLVPMFFPFLDALDAFLNTHPYSPFIGVFVPLLLCLCYPSLEKWNTARGDTTIIMGVGAGIAVASWINHQQGYLVPSEANLPLKVMMPDVQWFGHVVLRMLLGGSMLVATRLFVKRGTYRVTCHLLRLDYKTISKERYEAQRLVLELPYKYITYFVMGIIAVYVTPIVFRYLDIDRADSQFEL